MPNRFQPIPVGTSQDQILAAMNRNFAELDNENVTKVFNGASAGTLSIITGKLPYEGGYGSLYYDTTGTARILIGVAPDGEIDIAASVSGQDVTELYT